MRVNAEKRFQEWTVGPAIFRGCRDKGASEGDSVREEKGGGWCLGIQMKKVLEEGVLRCARCC